MSGLIPGLGRSLREDKGYLLQFSGLENSMDCIVHGVAKSQTQLSDFHFHPVKHVHLSPWSAKRQNEQANNPLNSQSAKTKQTSELDSDMTQMLELSDNLK